MTTCLVLCVVGKPLLDDPCNYLICKAGRECKIDEDGYAECVCVKECPKHLHPVCGSNNKTYVNHCHLHREACLKHHHLSVKHKGSCKHSNDESSHDSSKPVACFQMERDQLRERIIAWLHGQMKSADVLRWTSSYNDLIWAEFFTCDLNKDSFIDANEFLECVKDNATTPVILQSDHADLMRALCVDAIMDIADTNHDWKLDYIEFRNCMDPEFKAGTKQCSLEDRLYNDGEDITVDCNHCICACGNWVCTLASCSTNHKNETYEVKLVADGDKHVPSTLEDWSYSVDNVDNKVEKVEID